MNVASSPKSPAVQTPIKIGPEDFHSITAYNAQESQEQEPGIKAEGLGAAPADPDAGGNHQSLTITIKDAKGKPPAKCDCCNLM